MFSKFLDLIRQVVRKILPYKNIESAEHVETTLSTEMENALNKWYDMYTNQADWLNDDSVKSLNLPAFICAEVSRCILIELKWNITAAKKKPADLGTSQKGDNKDGSQESSETAESIEIATNPRAEYLKSEFKKCIKIAREKLEQGVAAGSMAIKPYPNIKDGHIYFDWVMGWSLFPVAFDDDGRLTDVIFRDSYTEGRSYYTRLERHTLQGDDVVITQKAYRSNMRESLGTEISLTEVAPWAGLVPKATVKNAGGALFGWYKVASANSVDLDSPMGVAIFDKACDTIKEADKQYSRLLWEYEAAEMAIDVDPTALRPVNGKDGKLEMPHLKERLFRAVGIDKGDRDLYEVYAPSIRDANYITGMNQLFMRIEDQCGLARGTLSDTNIDARTATELKINKQRSYVTIASNQENLQACFEDVIRAMDKYATLYNLAPEGDYEVSFEWDDSIITDHDEQLQERLAMLDKGLISKAEARAWYLGETESQAEAALKKIAQEQADEQATRLSGLLPGGGPNGNKTPDDEDTDDDGNGETKID